MISETVLAVIIGSIATCIPATISATLLGIKYCEESSCRLNRDGIEIEIQGSHGHATPTKTVSPPKSKRGSRESESISDGRIEAKGKESSKEPL